LPDWRKSKGKKKFPAVCGRDNGRWIGRGIKMRILACGLRPFHYDPRMKVRLTERCKIIFSRMAKRGGEKHP
jgi:hypothetical protein